MGNLDLGVIGNCSFAALIDKRARIVWCCLPRFDGDPVFCSLLDADSDDGCFAISIDDPSHSEQEYVENTAILVTRLFSRGGDGVEIMDFIPRHTRLGRRFRPGSLVRRIRPIAGLPRIRVQVRPRFQYGKTAPQVTTGSNHLRYGDHLLTLRLTTDLPIDYITEERPFLLREPKDLILGPDEPLSASVAETAREWLERTEEYWRIWVRSLTIPFEWQEAVVRSAITLKLCSYEQTGGIVAALTTSIPEAPNSTRNWDYRFCWPRDSYFTIQALNRVAAHQTMEDYLVYLENLVAAADDHVLQPVYGISGEATLTESVVENLAGFLGIGPVRRGNQAYEQVQHDVYGEVILAAAQAFFDTRLLRPGTIEFFHRLEPLGEKAVQLFDKPDAGLWELRTKNQVHTLSSAMCWAACDRLAMIAARFDLPERVAYWVAHAKRIRDMILERAWDPDRDTFTAAFGSPELDASLLLLPEIGFIKATDARFLGTLAAVESALVRGNHMFRYIAPDDFGTPKNAFNICSFWYVSALAASGRHDEARAHFEEILKMRNHLGLLSEDYDPTTGTLWGNYPQTYSHVGLIHAAIRLSQTWEQALRGGYGHGPEC